MRARKKTWTFFLHVKFFASYSDSFLLLHLEEMSTNSDGKNRTAVLNARTQEGFPVFTMSMLILFFRKCTR